MIEVNYAPLRRPSLMLPVSSFVAEAKRRAPEVPQLPCVGITQTAAEKLVSSCALVSAPSRHGGLSASDHRNAQSFGTALRLEGEWVRFHRTRH